MHVGPTWMRFSLPCWQICLTQAPAMSTCCLNWLHMRCAALRCAMLRYSCHVVAGATWTRSPLSMSHW